MIPNPQIRFFAFPLRTAMNWPRVTEASSVSFISPLSRIPTGKNKFHHLCTEIGHDGNHPFRGKTLWESGIQLFRKL